MNRLVLWRHPRPSRRRTAGRCIGRTDVPADRRKARRLARRILAWVAATGWPGRTIWTSPLARGAVVGRLLRQHGFEHRCDARLAEVDFGRWDGQPWSAIERDEIDAWAADLGRHRPGGGEALVDLEARLRAFVASLGRADSLVIGHGGWIRLARALAAGETVNADNWQGGLIDHGQRLELDLARLEDGRAPAPGPGLAARATPAASTIPPHHPLPPSAASPRR